MSLKPFKQFYLSEMSIPTGKVDKAIALVKKYIEKKIGVKLFRYGGDHGFSHFEKANSSKPGYGILYFIGNSGKSSIRFNWTSTIPNSKASIDNIDSIDFWFGGKSLLNEQPPTKSLHTANLKLYRILRQIANIIKAPNSTNEVDYHNVHSMDISGNPKEEIRQADDETYISDKQAKQSLTEAVSSDHSSAIKLSEFLASPEAKKDFTSSVVLNKTKSNAALKIFKSLIESPQAKNLFDINGNKYKFKGNVNTIVWEQLDVHYVTRQIGLSRGVREKEIDSTATKMEEALKQLDPGYLQNLLDQGLREMLPKKGSKKDPAAHVGFIVRGTPGTGKTFTLKKIFEEKGLKDGRELEEKNNDRREKGLPPLAADYLTVSGKASPAKVFEYLWLYRDRIIVFDDCNGILLDPDGMELLKASLQTNPKQRTPTWATRRADIFQGTESEFLEMTGEKPKKTKDGGEEEGEGEGEDMDGSGESTEFIAPVSFLFKGQLIFITNLAPEKLDSAFKDRCFFLDVRMTGSQVISLCKQLVDKLGNDADLSSVPVVLKKKVIDFFEVMYADEMNSFEHSISIRTIITKGIKTAASGAKNWKSMVAGAMNRPDIMLKLQKGEMKENADISG